MCPQAMVSGGRVVRIVRSDNINQQPETGEKEAK